MPQEFRYWQKMTWKLTPRVSLMLTIMLLFLSSCSIASPAVTSQSTPHAHDAPTPTPRPIKTLNNGTTQSNIGRRSELLSLHKLQGPDGWIWQTSLPHNRLVIFYGNPLSPVMGPIGAYSDDKLIARLREQTRIYADLDPSHPAVPAFDYVTPIAQPVPMRDSSWIYRMPDDSISHYVDLAFAHHLLYYLDMQIGHSPIQKEVNSLWPYLQKPGVDLSLDPEFDMAPGAVPGVQFGRMHASEVNSVIDQLSNLVMTQHLPPKILIIHQFLPEMLPDWQNIKLKPGVEIVTFVDGFGSPEPMIRDYQVFDKMQLIQYPGMKLFYKLDKAFMSPANVLALDPSPLMVMYQ